MGYAAIVYIVMRLHDIGPVEFENMYPARIMKRCENRMNLFCNKKKSSPPINNIFKIIIIIIAVIIILHQIIINSSVFYRKQIILPFSLHLNRQELVLVKGEEFRLFVYGINLRVSYSSTNFRVAGVNFNGRVNAHQPGKTIIIAKVKNKDKELKCLVRVIDINKDKLSLEIGDTYRLKVKGIFALPKWYSSNSEVATVNWFGKVKAKGKGRTVISTKIKGKPVKCIVQVD